MARSEVTDRETLLRLFRDRGVTVIEPPSNPSASAFRHTYSVPEEGSCFVVEGGYSGFFTVFVFDADGRLTGIEAYE